MNSTESKLSDLLNIKELKDYYNANNIKTALLFCFGTSVISKIIQAKTRIDDDELVPSHVAMIIDNHIYESTTDAVRIDHKNIKSGVRRWMIDDYIKSEYKKQTNYAVYNMEDLINKEIADSYIHLPYGKDTILDFLLKDGSEGESHGLICSQFANLVVQLLPEKKCPTPADLYREVLRLNSMDGDNNVL